MRNITILGASALVLALGVAQASATAQPAEQNWADWAARNSAQPAYVGELREFRGQPAGQNVWQATDQLPTDRGSIHSTSHY